MRRVSVVAIVAALSLGLMANKCEYAPTFSETEKQKDVPQTEAPVETPADKVE